MRRPTVRRWKRAVRRLGGQTIRRLWGLAGVSLDDPSTLESELRKLGPDRAIRRYTLARRIARPSALELKLARAYAMIGSYESAADVVRESRLPHPTAALLELEYLLKAERPTGDLVPLLPRTGRRDFLRGLTFVGRSVRDPEDLSVLLAGVSDIKPRWKADPLFHTRLANAARRAGMVELALERFETALRTSTPPRGNRPASSADRPLNRPWDVLSDFLDLLGEDAAEVFADAGTLLGLVREGGFIGHDYDMDFGTMSPDIHSKIRAATTADWRFELESGRSEDVIKIRHINGTDIDVFLMQRRGERFVKASHVYGWEFEPFSLEERPFGPFTVSVPSDPERYLEQMYGPEWMVPQPGFDSRLHAPNVFFPEREEILCTVLNKLVAAIRAGRGQQVAVLVDFLEGVLGYSLPTARQPVEADASAVSTPSTSDD